MWLFFVNTYFILQFKYFKSNYFTRATYAHDCMVIMIKKYNIYFIDWFCDSKRAQVCLTNSGTKKMYIT